MKFRNKNAPSTEKCLNFSGLVRCSLAYGGEFVAFEQQLGREYGIGRIMPQWRYKNILRALRPC
jgi:hypothetical protein